jgi:uncharacterized protein
MKQVRTCIGCAKRDQLGNLVKIKSTLERLTVDFEGKLPGRGTSVHPSRSCINRAIERRAFQKAFLTSAPFDLSGLLEQIEQAEKMLAKK